MFWKTTRAAILIGGVTAAIAATAQPATAANFANVPAAIGHTAIAASTAVGIELVGSYGNEPRRRRRAADTYSDDSTYDDGYSGDEPIYSSSFFGIYLGEQPSGRYGCRHRYSGYYLDEPCWARKALAPPRDR